MEIKRRKKGYFKDKTRQSILHELALNLYCRRFRIEIVIFYIGLCIPCHQKIRKNVQHVEWHSVIRANWRNIC